MSRPQIDTASAVTRSLLGWGVVAGPFYVVVGLVLALTRPGFDLSKHALSLLMLGDLGWLQRANVILSGLMVLAAAYGILRLIRSGRGLAIGVLVGVYGVGLVLSGIFPPDPVAGFPPGSEPGASVSGILHLLFGALGFVAIGAAAFAYAAWCRAEQVSGRARLSVVLGVLVLVGFVAGAALAQSPVGVALLWIAVLAAWGWLALASARLYAWTPHPVTGARR
ncbi:putative membrane protein [Microbacterium sp. SLBN-111]